MSGNISRLVSNTEVLATLSSTKVVQAGAEVSLGCNFFYAPSPTGGYNKIKRSVTGEAIYNR